MTLFVASFTDKHTNQLITQHIDPTRPKQPRSTCVHERYDLINKQDELVSMTQKENSRKALRSRVSPVWDKLTARAVRETPTLFMSARLGGWPLSRHQAQFSR